MSILNSVVWRPATKDDKGKIAKFWSGENGWHYDFIYAIEEVSGCTMFYDTVFPHTKCQVADEEATQVTLRQMLFPELSEEDFIKMWKDPETLGSLES